MKWNRFFRRGILISAALLVMLLCADISSAHAARSHNPIPARRTWATRYGHALTSHTTAKQKTALAQSKPALSTVSTFDVTNTAYMPGAFESTPTLAVDPGTATSTTPNIVSAATDGTHIDLASTTTAFTSYQSRVQGSPATLTVNATPQTADGGIEPSAMITDKVGGTNATTCRKGFVAFAAYTNDATTYANGVAIYRETNVGTGTFNTTPITVASYGYDSTSSTILVADEPAMAFDPSKGAQGTLYLIYVLAAYALDNSTTPPAITYLGSDVYFSTSSNCGLNWGASDIASYDDAGAPTVCVGQHPGESSACDDVYYPSPVVSKTGNVWVAFLCQCAAVTPATGRGQYVLAYLPNGQGTSNTTVLEKPVLGEPVNNGDADYDPAAGGQQTLPGGGFYTNANGNLAYDSNIKLGTDGDLLLTFANAVTQGNPNTWGSLVLNIPANTDGTIGSIQAPTVLGGTSTNEAIFPHIANRPSGTGTVTRPVVGYYSWNQSTGNITYTTSELVLTYATGSLSSSASVSNASFTPGNYIGEYTGLDINAKDPPASGTNYGRIFSTFQAPASVSNVTVQGVSNTADPADQFVNVLKK